MAVRPSLIFFFLRKMCSLSILLFRSRRALRCFAEKRRLLVSSCVCLSEFAHDAQAANFIVSSFVACATATLSTSSAQRNVVPHKKRSQAANASAFAERDATQFAFFFCDQKAPVPSVPPAQRFSNATSSKRETHKSEKQQR